MHPYRPLRLMHRSLHIEKSRRRSRHVFSALLILVSVSLLAAASFTVRAPRIDPIILSDHAPPAFWGVFVQDVESGEVLYQHNARNAFMPASAQKLLTTAAALDALGSDFRYATTLYLDGTVRDATITGDLIIRGSGDPSFGSSLAGGEDPLRHWARRLAEIGVRRIEGRIVGDDSAFDDQPYAVGWDIDYVTTQSSRLLGVSTSGLSYSDNIVEISIAATGPGRPPLIRARPSGFLHVENELTTANRARGIAVRTRRTLGAESVWLQGSVPLTYQGMVVAPVTNPTAFTVHSFRQYLEQYGIEVAADVYDISDLPRFSYRTQMPLFVHVSPPLSEILRLVNKESNNFYADQVFRTFAYAGSAAGGERRILELLRRSGASTDGISIRDGSGLSRKDFVTPEAMSRLLVHMYDHPERAAFMASLAQGGEPRSTLSSRLRGVPVRAKTGSLESVRALSGYTTSASGRTLAFTVFANHFTAPSYQIIQTIDRIVMELAAST